MLPDDALLDIFDFCADEHDLLKEEIEAWQTLVHVCRRWRSLVFGSPRRLNLRLVCAAETPARDTLDVWPALPLVIQCWHRSENVDNIVAGLERSNRVCQINLRNVSSSDLEKVSAAMQVPSAELTDLSLWLDDKTEPVLPDSFLGSSAPRLRFLWFDGISFPGLPKLLLSATHLVALFLYPIPHSGYISPEAMLTALSSLTSLEELRLGFQSPLSCPEWASRRPPPTTPFVLPVLTEFRFKGVCEYLDDLVARFDSPQLNRLGVTLFNQIVLDTPQFIQFIIRTPTLKAFEKAEVSYNHKDASIKLSSRTSSIDVRIRCKELDWQFSSLEQVCTSCLPPLSTLADLYIFEYIFWPQYWRDNIDNTLWSELLHPFTGVKNLYLSEKFARRIVPALQELVGGRTTEVLPALENIFLQGFKLSKHVHNVQEGIGHFVSTRQAIGHPIAVSGWDPWREDGITVQEVDG